MAYQPVKSEEDDSLDGEYSAFDGRAQSIDGSACSVQSRRWFKPVVQVFFALMGIVIVILLSMNVMMLRSTLRKQDILNAQHSDPNFNTLPSTYGRDRRFMTLDPQYDHLWDEWTADAQIMIPGDLPGEGMLQGAYSMFHQMHCLASFRRAIQVARNGTDPGFDYLDNGHWPHCFDYLRNTILCWADNTVEHAAVLSGKRLPFIDGTSTVRQCRSPESMYERMRKDEKAVEQANRDDGLDHEGGHHHQIQHHENED